MSINHIGTKIAIATGVPATFDDTGFGAMTWVEDAEGTVTIGAVGDTHETITVPDITTGRNMTLKGAVTGDTINVAISRKRQADNSRLEGQAAMKAAAQASGGEYSFKVTETDGTIQYFAGNVMNWKETERSSTSYAGNTFDVTINYDVVDVDPT